MHTCAIYDVKHKKSFIFLELFVTEKIFRPKQNKLFLNSIHTYVYFLDRYQEIKIEEKMKVKSRLCLLQL